MINTKISTIINAMRFDTGFMRNIGNQAARLNAPDDMLISRIVFQCGRKVIFEPFNKVRRRYNANLVSEADQPTDYFLDSGSPGGV